MRFSLDRISDFSNDEDGFDDIYDEECENNDHSSPCSSPGESLNDYSIVNPEEQDGSIPQLYLPKYKVENGLRARNNETIFEETLDPELKQMTSILDIRSKLPTGWQTRTNSMKRPDITETDKERTETGVLKNMNNDVTEKNTTELLAAMQRCFITKVTVLEKENRKQIENVACLKRRAEEERRRKQDEERKCKEEDERRKREAEAERRRQQQDKAKREEDELRIKKMKEEEAKSKLEAAHKAKLERQRKVEQEELKQEALKVKTVTNFASIEKEYRKYRENIAKIKRDIVEPVKTADPNLKSLLSRHKRKLNPKFGQLTNSNKQLEKIALDICNLVDDTRSNQLAYLWILNFIAKAMVHQAETEVRVKPESGLPLGKLALNLLIKYPELHALLLARFVKKCPFVIGYSADIQIETGRQDMGWKRNSDDKWEEDTSYDERMGGIMTLYAIITRLSLPPQLINSMEHPLPIANSWRMVARLCNTPMDLLTNTHFIVLGAWWDAAASIFLQAYGNQGAKLLQLAANELTSLVFARKYVGAARVRILFEEWQTNGIKSFPDMEY